MPNVRPLSINRQHIYRYTGYVVYNVCVTFLLVYYGKQKCGRYGRVDGHWDLAWTGIGYHAKFVETISKDDFTAVLLEMKM